jgi:hypothetical protein
MKGQDEDGDHCCFGDLMELNPIYGNKVVAWFLMVFARNTLGAVDFDSFSIRWARKCEIYLS